MTKVVVVSATVDSVKDLESLKKNINESLDVLNLDLESDELLDEDEVLEDSEEEDADYEDDDFEGLINVPNQISAEELTKKEDIEVVKFVDYVNDVAYKIYDKIREYVNPESSSHYVTYKVDNSDGLLEALKEHFQFQGYDFSYEVVPENEEDEDSEKVAKITLRW